MTGRPVIDELAELFGLDPSRIGRPDVFAAVVAEAVAVLGAPGAVLDEVAALGPLRGARDGWAVLLGRLRRIPADHAERQQVGAERAEADRWAAVDRAARRGETLRALVARGLMFADEAAEQVAAEYRDPELHAIALAALDGGAS